MNSELDALLQVSAVLPIESDTSMASECNVALLLHM